MNNLFIAGLIGLGILTSGCVTPARAEGDADPKPYSSPAPVTIAPVSPVENDNDIVKVLDEKRNIYITRGEQRLFQSYEKLPFQDSVMHKAILFGKVTHRDHEFTAIDAEAVGSILRNVAKGMDICQKQGFTGWTRVEVESRSVLFDCSANMRKYAPSWVTKNVTNELHSYIVYYIVDEVAKHNSL
jgi:hypothetical protein